MLLVISRVFKRHPVILNSIQFSINFKLVNNLPHNYQCHTQVLRPIASETRTKTAFDAARLPSPSFRPFSPAMDDMDWDVSTFSGVKREGDGPRLYCDACGGTDFASGDDGFYYCQMCGSQSQDVVDTGCAMEDILGGNHGSGVLYSLYRSRARTQSQTPAPAVRKDDILRSLANSLASGRNPKKEEEKGPPYGFEEEPSAPRDFPTGSCSDADALAIGIRMRYIQGLQVILQLQCEALVEKFGVSPIICGIAGTIWLRYVASSMVFDEGWAQKTIEVSESAFAQFHHGRPGIGLYHLYASSHA